MFMFPQPHFLRLLQQNTVLYSHGAAVVKQNVFRAVLIASALISLCTGNSLKTFLPQFSVSRHRNMEKNHRENSSSSSRAVLSALNPPSLILQPEVFYEHLTEFVYVGSLGLES